MDWASKKVLVVGMARSGIAAAQLLLEKGAVPVLNDAKPAEAFSGDLNSLANLGAVLRMGEDPLMLLGEVDSVVISPGVPINLQWVISAQKRGLPLIGELELASQFDKGEMVAITGTNGKTTTVTLLGEIFKNAGKIAHVAGNIGYPYSKVAMEARPDDVTVVEVSSFQLESISSFHPKVAAVLNVTEDHLNRHGTMREYTRLKMRIFENQSERDVAVLNFDDPILQEMGASLKSRVMWFSRLRAVPSGAYVEDGKIMCAYNGEVRQVVDADEVRIPGPHNLENALAATCVAAAMGVPVPVIRHTLRTFEGVEHRIEFVRTLRGITYINDSKGTNVDSTIKAVQTMREPTAIILGGYDKHADFAPLAQAIVCGSAITAAVVIGQTGAQIKNTLVSAGFRSIKEALTLEEATQKATDMLQSSGNVLLSPACASFDMFSDYEERGRMFKELVTRLS